MVKDYIHIIYIHVIVSGLDYVQHRNSSSVKSVKNAQMRLHVQAIAKVLGGKTQTRYRTNMLKHAIALTGCTIDVSTTRMYRILYNAPSYHAVASF